MEITETENLDPEVRIQRLTEWGERLYRRLKDEQTQSARLREEAARWKGVAEAEHTSWVRTHCALNLLRQEAVAVLEAHGALPLHHELETVRADNERLKRYLSQRRVLTRKAVEEMVTARQENRAKDELIGQLKRRLNRLETERDEVARTAEKTVGALDQKLKRIQEQCRLWERGELDTMTTIAGVCGEMSGFPLPEPGAWERAKAVRAAELLSQHRDMALQLGTIEDLLGEEGVSLETTHADMVRVYIADVKGGRND